MWFRRRRPLLINKLGSLVALSRTAPSCNPGMTAPSKAPAIELHTASIGHVLCSSHGVLFLITDPGSIVHLPLPAELGKVIVAAHSSEPPRLLVAAATHQKHLVVYSVSVDTADGNPAVKLSQLVKHTVPKRPTNILFGPDNKSVIFSDAFGDVYRIPLSSDEASVVVLKPDATDQAAPDESGPGVTFDTERALLFGHFSSITSMIMTPGPGPHRVLSGDRDARIRVSRFPLAHVIDSFCLGHTDVITALLHLPGGHLLSGCASGSLSLWNIDGDGHPISSLDLRPHLTQAEDGNSLPVVSAVVATGENSAWVAIARYPAILSVSGLDTKNPSVSIVKQCGGPITGLVSEKSGAVWFSVSNSDGSNSLHHLKCAGGEEAEVDFKRYEETAAKVHMVAECTTDALKGDKATPKSDQTGKKKSKRKDVDDDEVIGRFEWLSRQRKKEMVVDWKGKKRRHIETLQ